MSISKQRMEKIEAIEDEQIDYTDIPELDEGFWNRAALHMPEPNKGVYIRLDPDVLAWLKSNGKGYETRLNATLRALMKRDRQAR